jgi:hypothetical protein
MDQTFRPILNASSRVTMISLDIPAALREPFLEIIRREPTR